MGGSIARTLPHHIACICHWSLTEVAGIVLNQLVSLTNVQVKYVQVKYLGETVEALVAYVPGKTGLWSQDTR